MTDFAYLDGHHSIIGASDSGKTWTAKFGVEELLRQRRHTLIIDPLGVYYGMRSSADGKGPGFDIPIFGGLHGDVPIDVGDGEAIGAIVDDQRVSAIVDLSLITDGLGQRTFVRAMVARLRRRRHGNFHFVVDEADEFVPEKPRDDVAYALQEDMLWIAKKGRSPGGWVLTLITQRTADIAKSALSQSQTIIAHQLIAPQDQKPFLDYIRTKGSKAELAEIESNLASLPQGERYVYSPRRRILELGRTPALTTFDSSKTPPPGKRRLEPRTLAQLDVSAIAAALARPNVAARDTIPADPVTALKQGAVDGAMLAKRDLRIAELETANASLTDELGRLRAHYERRGNLIGYWDAALSTIRSAIDSLPEDGVFDASAPSSRIICSSKPKSPPPPDPTPAPRGADVSPRAGSGDSPATGEASTLTPALQRILDQLAWANEAFHKRAIPRQVLALVLETHPRTKGFLNNLGTLRTAGLIDYPEAATIALTAAGVERAARPGIAGATLADLRGRLVAWVPPAQARILKVAIGMFPTSVNRDTLADMLGLHPRTKTLLNNIGRLKTLGLLTAPSASQLRAAPYLFGKDA